MAIPTIMEVYKQGFAAYETLSPYELEFMSPAYHEGIEMVLMVRDPQSGHLVASESDVVGPTIRSRLPVMMDRVARQAAEAGYTVTNLADLQRYYQGRPLYTPQRGDFR